MKTILLGLLLAGPVCLAQEVSDTSVTLAQATSEETSFVSEVKFAPQPLYKENDNEKRYKLKPFIDYPIVAVGGGWTLYAFSKIYTKSQTPIEDVERLDKKNVPAFDRWSAGWHDDNLDKVSYYPFYVAMPLPLAFLADRKIRKDFGRVGVLYLESMAITGTLYTGAVYTIDRYRPDVYNTALEMDYRSNGNFRNSFFAGHVALVATSTFFMAKVYNDYHPDKNFKYVMWGTAIAATGSMGWMRIQAGKHFLSDVLLGIAVGAASGILVPELHKNKNFTRSLSVVPSFSPTGGTGLSVVYKL